MTGLHVLIWKEVWNIWRTWNNQVMRLSDTEKSETATETSKERVKIDEQFLGAWEQQKKENTIVFQTICFFDRQEYCYPFVFQTEPRSQIDFIFKFNCCVVWLLSKFSPLFS